MIRPKVFFDALQHSGIYNFSGVPDSLLKYICAYISDNTPAENHLITANEGSAISLAVWAIYLYRKAILRLFTKLRVWQYN